MSQQRYTPELRIPQPALFERALELRLVNYAGQVG